MTEHAGPDDAAAALTDVSVEHSGGISGPTPSSGRCHADSLSEHAGPTDTAVALADAAEATTAGAVSGGNFRGRELEEEVELTVEADLVDSDVLVGWLTSSGVAQAWEVASTVHKPNSGRHGEHRKSKT
ncbi:MAG: hypothetical protein M1821_007442 [Bathelium mastoideum]|nr:MAG: hypothetical protein M1821_007442 [Bathelium mastoideum]